MRKPNHSPGATISERVWKGTQSVNYEQVFEFGPNRLRVRIKRDAYDNQSHARVHVWLGGWVLVCSTPIEWMYCRTLSYTDPVPKADAFDDDFMRLFQEAASVLEAREVTVTRTVHNTEYKKAVAVVVAATVEGLEVEGGPGPYSPSSVEEEVRVTMEEIIRGVKKTLEKQGEEGTGS